MAWEINDDITQSRVIEYTRNTLKQIDTQRYPSDMTP